MTEPKKYKYTNKTEVPLAIPEMGLTLEPGKSFITSRESATLSLFTNKDMLAKTETTESESIDTHEMPVIPAVTTKPTKPGVIVRHLNNVNKSVVANYENKASIRDAFDNVEVKINDGASVIVRPKGETFSQEMPADEYASQNAENLLRQARIPRSDSQTNIKPLPPDTPKEVAKWMEYNITQKKIILVKTTDIRFLELLKNYETDENVLSCIEERLTELAEEEAQ